MSVPFKITTWKQKIAGDTLSPSGVQLNKMLEAFPRPYFVLKTTARRTYQISFTFSQLKTFSMLQLLSVCERMRNERETLSTLHIYRSFYSRTLTGTGVTPGTGNVIFLLLFCFEWNFPSFQVINFYHSHNFVFLYIWWRKQGDYLKVKLTSVDTSTEIYLLQTRD